MFTLHISTDNAAFTDAIDPDWFPDEARTTELARILREIAADIRESGSGGSAFDINGNNVGEWVIS